MIDTIMALWNKAMRGRLLSLVLACIIISISLTLLVTFGVPVFSRPTTQTTAFIGPKAINFTGTPATNSTPAVQPSPASGNLTPTPSRSLYLESPCIPLTETNSIDDMIHTGIMPTPMPYTPPFTTTKQTPSKTPTPTIIKPTKTPTPNPPSTATPTHNITPTPIVPPKVTSTPTPEPDLITPTPTTNPDSNNDITPTPTPDGSPEVVMGPTLTPAPTATQTTPTATTTISSTLTAERTPTATPHTLAKHKKQPQKDQNDEPPTFTTNAQEDIAMASCAQ